MILVDTSIWIDHLRRSNPALTSLLVDDQVGCHPAVIEELALGSMRHRDRIIELLENLWTFPVLSHPEVRQLVEGRRFWGRGLSAVDVHLFGAVLVVPGASLWTNDKRLRAVCGERAYLAGGADPESG